MKTQYTLLLFILIFSNSYCFAKSPENVSDLIKQAEELRQITKKHGFEWTTIGPLISQAQTAAQSGDQNKAKNFAIAAIKQAEEAIKQAKLADENWQKAAL